MTQAELAEFIKDAFDGVVWRNSNLEPEGTTTLEKFKRAMDKHRLGRLPVVDPGMTRPVGQHYKVQAAAIRDPEPNDPRLD